MRYPSTRALLFALVAGSCLACASCNDAGGERASRRAGASQPQQAPTPNAPASAHDVSPEASTQALARLQLQAAAGDPWAMHFLAVAYLGPSAQLWKKMEATYAGFALPAQAEPYRADAALVAASGAVKRDANSALALFRKAADAGHTPSMFYLALALVGGKDYGSAFELLTKAADAGDPLAALLIGNLYRAHAGAFASRTTPPLSTEEATKRVLLYLKQANEAGLADADVFAALIHANGLGVPKDPRLAARLVKQAKDAGSKLAADMFKQAKAGKQADGQPAASKVAAAGDGRQQAVPYTPEMSGAEALAWLRQQAETGNVWAMHFLAEAHIRSIKAGRMRYYRMARSYNVTLPARAVPYRMAAAHILKLKALNGDYRSAERLLRKAIAAGHTRSMTYLGEMYGSGLGVARDKVKSIRLWKMAADAGDPIAAMEMNRRYFYDDDGFRNVANPPISKGEEARLVIGYLKRATDAGITRARYYLARIYLEGRGVNPSRREGMPLMRQAAAAGDAQARKYLDGRDPARALVEAKWASITSGDWPPPDIRFKSAADFHRQYTQAPTLGGAAFLAKVHRVSIGISSTTALKKLLKPREKLWLPVVKAIRAEGIEVLPNSPVKLRIRLLLHSAWHGNDSNGNGRFRVDNNIFTVLVQFIVPARLYRDGAFYHRNVAIAFAFATDTSHGNFSRADLLNGIRSGVARAFDYIREPEHIADDRAQWLATLWEARDAPAMLRKYQDARRDKRDDLERWYTGANAYSDIDVDRLGAAVRLLNASSIKRRWQANLRDNAFRYAPRSPIFIKHRILSYFDGPGTMKGLIFGSTYEQFYWNVDVVRIYQKNVVYNFDGKLYRAPRVALQIGYGDTIALEKDLDGTLEDEVRGHIRDITNEMRFRR